MLGYERIWEAVLAMKLLTAIQTHLDIPAYIVKDQTDSLLMVMVFDEKPCRRDIKDDVH